MDDHVLPADFEHALPCDYYPCVNVQLLPNLRDLCDASDALDTLFRAQERVLNTIREIEIDEWIDLEVDHEFA